MISVLLNSSVLPGSEYGIIMAMIGERTIFTPPKITIFFPEAETIAVEGPRGTGPVGTLTDGVARVDAWRAIVTNASVRQVVKALTTDGYIVEVTPSDFNLMVD